MRSDLLSQTETTSTDRWALQNAQLLRVTLGGDAIVARQGAMVAYQGQASFDYQGAGGIKKMVKQKLSGEGVATMKIRPNALRAVSAIMIISPLQRR